MPEISRFYGIIIRMYFQDHNPPHFHAEYQGMRAEYSIETLEVLAGKIPLRAHSLVLEWASLYRKDLLENWDRAKMPSQLKKIQPLN
jgi:hypothetical protein